MENLSESVLHAFCPMLNQNQLCVVSQREYVGELMLLLSFIPVTSEKLVWLCSSTVHTLLRNVCTVELQSQTNFWEISLTLQFNSAHTTLPAAFSRPVHPIVIESINQSMTGKHQSLQIPSSGINIGTCANDVILSVLHQTNWKVGKYTKTANAVD